ncbi:MAG: bifunctional nuclease family protein [Gemmataceae bacterium]|jgi:bifunctional DNase/RNase
MPVEMELRRIIISEIHEQQVIILKELDGDRSFSIQIGIFEATSIDRKIKKIPSPRPLTHDLLCQTIHSLGGELQEIQITQLKEKTYFATLKIGQNGRAVEVDCRPSDAIALAVTMDVPIFVFEDVLNQINEEI